MTLMLTAADTSDDRTRSCDLLFSIHESRTCALTRRLAG